MSAGLSHGFRRGYFTTVGLILGIWTQALIVALGLGALIATSPLAYQVVKWAGVACLVYRGRAAVAGRAQAFRGHAGGRRRARRAP